MSCVNWMALCALSAVSGTGLSTAVSISGDLNQQGEYFPRLEPKQVDKNKLMMRRVKEARPSQEEPREQMIQNMPSPMEEELTHVAEEAYFSEAIRSALRHMWQGYKHGAWGSDEVRPLTGGAGGEYGRIGIALIDWMDTLWLAGMHKEFNETEKWVADLDLDPESSQYHQPVSFFEVTIRALGGLLGGYALSGREVLLQKASELGRKLEQAFPQNGHRSAHAWPYSAIDIRDPSNHVLYPSWLGANIVAEAGSNILEFTYLSEAAVDPSHKKLADANENALLTLASKEGHLLGQHLAPHRHSRIKSKITVGGEADSYYEYLLKQYLQGGKRDIRLLREWKAAMSQMRKDLVRKSPGGLTFIASEVGSSEMDHLACFMGGLLILGSHAVPKDEVEDWWLQTGLDVTDSCYEMYRQTPTGLAGDRTSFLGTTLSPSDSRYLLRPEALESLFYAYRVTGNNTYREWGNDIFAAINKQLRAKYGFAIAQDVTQVPPPLGDSEETFVGAETFKYALLLNLPPSVLPLDRFVFNTEAHPFPVVDAASLPHIPQFASPM